mmetsp:Transcript_6507/g.11036  ORF Transcript_6507/g.11036 Transcript_6507/m.11036 type:complete len:175 (+) Transcript_6507:1050-1574(+)
MNNQNALSGSESTKMQGIIPANAGAMGFMGGTGMGMGGFSFLPGSQRGSFNFNPQALFGNNPDSSTHVHNNHTNVMQFLNTYGAKSGKSSLFTTPKSIGQGHLLLSGRLQGHTPKQQHQAMGSNAMAFQGLGTSKAFKKRHGGSKNEHQSSQNPKNKENPVLNFISSQAHQSSA